MEEHPRLSHPPLRATVIEGRRADRHGENHIQQPQPRPPHLPKARRHCIVVRRQETLAVDVREQEARVPKVLKDQLEGPIGRGHVEGVGGRVGGSECGPATAGSRRGRPRDVENVAVHEAAAGAADLPFRNGLCAGSV